VSSWAGSDSSMLLEFEGRYQEARDGYQRLVQQYPSVITWQVDLDRLNARLGASGPAIQHLRTLSQRTPMAAQSLARVEALAGHREEALRVLQTLEQNFQGGRVFAYYVAEAYAILDDETNAVKWLQKSMELREFAIVFLHVDPDFSRLQ